jgi:hypothetical protein
MFNVADSNQRSIDAHFDIDGSAIVVHARGGSGKQAVNTQYADGLRIILERLKEARIQITDAQVASRAVLLMPAEKRRILPANANSLDVESLMGELASRMRAVREDGDEKAKGGNSTKKIRIETTATDAEALRVALKGIPVSKDTRSQERLPAELLSKVGEQHIYNAVQLLLSGNAKHPFGESTDFDVLLEDGTRLPPKAVFGIAAKEALGMEVLPKHFSGGEGTICFRIINACGYTIVPKDGSEPAGKAPKPAAPAVSSNEDREFVEGKKERVYHLKSERDRYAPIAKKAAFKAKHGILFCERCLMKPVEVYKSEAGEACIEVHHTKPIAEMKEGDKTKLEDLQCLCASCHRVVHRELRLADK